MRPTHEVGLFFLGAIAGVMTLPICYYITTWLWKKKCWVKHDYHHFQGTVVVSDVNMGGRNTEVNVVIAWKLCRRCAKSKLIHLLN